MRVWFIGEHSKDDISEACTIVVWCAMIVFLNASGMKDGLAAMEINCAIFDKSDTSTEILGLRQL